MTVLAGAALLSVGCGGGAAKRAAAEKAAAEAAEKSQLDSMAQAEKAIKVSEQLANLAEEPVFDIITTMGTIRIKLYSDTPKHKANFAKLALEGFYDGILFHRIINGFMIQTGDPLTKDMNNKHLFGTGGLQSLSLPTDTSRELLRQPVAETPPIPLRNRAVLSSTSFRTPVPALSLTAPIPSSEKLSRDLMSLTK